MLKVHELQELKSLLPRGQVFTDQSALISYEVDAGLDRGLPEAVVFPHSEDDVVRIVRWAAAHAVPLIARGAGTGLSGGAVAERGGIIVEFARMNHILDIDEYGRTAVVEPGVINLALDEQARLKGLYFPPDPASQRASTIGGNVSENSGGPHCFKYGVTTNYVTGMRVVLADGRLVQVGGRALDYPGYDLCGLLTGSEGTLALMTTIFVRLVRNPPAVKTMLAVFDSVEQAGLAVSAIIAAGLVPATMEMMDQKIIRIVEAYVHAGLPTEAEAMLIIEVDGYPASLDRQIEEVSSILRAQGGHSLRVAKSEEERSQIWFARKSAAGAITRLAPSYYTVDITVPRSRLTETLSEVNQVCEHYDLQVGYVFHAGDGNLHPLVLIPDPQDKGLIERVHRAGREMVELAVSKGGSLSGEHGVGIEKREYMSLMYNDAELSAMEDIKRAFDPHGIFNPGKMLPVRRMAHETGQGQAIAPTMDGLHGEVFLERRRSWVDVGTGGREDEDAGASRLSWWGGWHSHETGTSTRPPRPHPHPPLVPTNPLGTSSTPAILQPATTEQAAAMLISAKNAHHKVYITGSQTPAPTGAGVILSTAALTGVKTYAPDDLYITVGAGTTLTEIQTFLASKGKQVPLATPWPEATIGGLIANNINAPLRIRYGSLRDLLLCLTVVLPDGRIIRTGRPIIKNVAGYDLTKIFVGSQGKLGLITDVTLKLIVPPRMQRTLLIPVDDLKEGLHYARKLLPLALVASAIVLCEGSNIEGMQSHPYILVYTAEGLPEDVQAELEQVREVLHGGKGPEVVEVEGPSGMEVWTRVLGGLREGDWGRAGVAVKDLGGYVSEQAGVLVDAGSGVVYGIMEDEERLRAARKME